MPVKGTRRQVEPMFEFFFFSEFPHLVLCVALTPALIYFDRVLLRLDQDSNVRCDT